MSNGHSEEGIAATAGPDYNDGHEYHAQEIQDQEQNERERRMKNLADEKTPFTRKAFMNKLITDNGLIPKEDVFSKEKQWAIIKLSGIEKIQNNHNIRVTFESEAIEKDFVVIKATAIGQNDSVQSYGSAIKGAYPHGNVTHSYLVEMAEKRAKARSVLKLCGAYKYGIKSEDEAEEFKQDSGKDGAFSKELQGPDT
jgi:hypothetical protein